MRVYAVFYYSSLRHMFDREL